MTLSAPLPGTYVSTSFYRVLYADTDTMGIVNNAVYFRIFEQGRGDYLRGRGMPYSEIEERGIRSPLTEAWAHFYKPFRYDDLIRIECWVSAIKKASFMFDYRLYRDEGGSGGASMNPEKGPEGSPVILVAGRTLHATLNYENKVVKFPDWLSKVLGPAE